MYESKLSGLRGKAAREALLEAEAQEKKAAEALEAEATWPLGDLGELEYNLVHDWVHDSATQIYNSHQVSFSVGRCWMMLEPRVNSESTLCDPVTGAG